VRLERLAAAARARRVGIADREAGLLQRLDPVDLDAVEHLLRLRIDPALGLVPEISANRLMVSIRLMRPDAEGKLKIASDTDASFELTLCA